MSALEVPIVYNNGGDNDPNGRLFVLKNNVPLVKKIKQDFYACRKFLAGETLETGDWKDGIIPTLKHLKEMPSDEFMSTFPRLSAYPSIIHSIRRGYKMIEELDVQQGKKAEFIISYKMIKNIIIDENPDYWTAIMPNEIIRPLAIRANLGETIEIHLENELDVPVGMHIQIDGYNVHDSDGTMINGNGKSFAGVNGYHKYVFEANKEGVFSINDMVNVSGGQKGTNVHGLFGAFIVEPAQSWWRHSENGDTTADGLYVDVMLQDVPKVHEWDFENETFVGQEYTDIPQHSSFREYVVFFHDEIEGKSIYGHGDHNNCHGENEPESNHEEMNQAEHRHEEMTEKMKISEILGEKGAELMALSLRSEPLNNKVPHYLLEMAAMCDNDGKPINDYIQPHIVYYHKHEGIELHNFDGISENCIGRKFIFKIDNEWFNGEEQHHSSWLFGDPDTPILRAYRGDPARIRLVQGGVKETHVFHLHVHQWRAILGDVNSPLIDSITIGPQGAMTIEPLYGAGSRQHTPGDSIWHCHLYPHFHHGMWGIWRTHDKLEQGTWNPTGEKDEIRIYPDGTFIPPLQPLPGNIPPEPTILKPGWPLFMPGIAGHKSPSPPGNPRRELEDEQGVALGLNPTTEESRNMIPDGHKFPGEWFTPIGPRREADKVFDVVVVSSKVTYYDESGTTWYDKDGHYYLLRSEYEEHKEKIENGTYQPEPLFIRANKGDIVLLKLENLISDTAGNHYNTGQINVDCGMHVHLVKFDVIAGDGGSSGWNYISGAMTSTNELGLKGTHEYRWYADEEFGTIFFHDHLLADYRQKRGLFAALIIEPEGADYLNPADLRDHIEFGAKAVIRYKNGKGEYIYFREFCIGIGDQIPLFKDSEEENNIALNSPGVDSMEDPGAMGVNYRCQPLAERKPQKWNPANWFREKDANAEDYCKTALQTPIWEVYPGDDIRIRIIDGSHEEQHSFMINGFRWNQYWTDKESPWRNQQTMGVSEAFTITLDTQIQKHKPGDYLWQFSSMDDMWLGCWGYLRLHKEECDNLNFLPSNKKPNFDETIGNPSANIRKFKVWAKQQIISYSPDFTDSNGLVYQLIEVDGKPIYPTLSEEDIRKMPVEAPLVLRCHAGEWIEVTVMNKIEKGKVIKSEAVPPKLPIENEMERTISSSISIHANLVSYDIQSSDGSCVGYNEDSTIGPGEKKTYKWFADSEGVSYLQDMADIRNHRHHGLVGALIIHSPDEIPYASNKVEEQWHGVEALVHSFRRKFIKDFALILQDGLSLEASTIKLPLLWGVESLSDPEDLGLKAFNYKARLFKDRQGELIEIEKNKFSGNRSVNQSRLVSILDGLPNQMENPDVLFKVKRGDLVRIHLIGASDRPRNHVFTIHGHNWKEIETSGNPSFIPKVGCLNGVSTGYTRTIEFTANDPGIYLFRTGVLKWAIFQGLWGYLEVEEMPATVTLT